MLCFLWFCCANHSTSLESFFASSLGFMEICEMSDGYPIWILRKFKPVGWKSQSYWIIGNIRPIVVIFKYNVCMGEGGGAGRTTDESTNSCKQPTDGCRPWN